MIPITDHVNSTSSHLQVNLQFFRNEYESSENIIQELQEQIARTLAHKIVNQRKFFTLSLVDNIGVMKADVIVFTEKELDEKITEAFNKGVKHSLRTFSEYNKFLDKL